MAIIYSYPLNDNIKPLDELVGTTEKNINGQLKTVTRNFLLSDLAEFFIVDGGLQKTITLTTDGSSGVSTLDQVTGVLNIPDYSVAIPSTPGLEQVLGVGNEAENTITLLSPGIGSTSYQAFRTTYIDTTDRSTTLFYADGIYSSTNLEFILPSSKVDGRYTLATLDDIPTTPSLQSVLDYNHDLIDGKNFQGTDAGNGAVNANNSNFFGASAGYSATNAYYSNFLGFTAGAGATSANTSNFIGTNAGLQAINASGSNFFGASAGYFATDANNSNFIGQQAGREAIDAISSNFLGQLAGFRATNASYSNLFGYNAGSSFTDNNIGSNNIIIGTNISLPDATINSINLGGVLFGTGTYSETANDPSIIPTSGGKIGIGVVEPTNTLHIYSEAADTSGLRLERLTSASPTSTGQAIGVDASGNVITVTGGGGSQNLQSVTDEGAATTNKITINPIGDINGLEINATGDGGGLRIITQNGVGIYSQSYDTAFTGNSDYGMNLVGFVQGLNIYSDQEFVASFSQGLTAKGLLINSGTSSSGNFIELNKNSVNKLIVNQAGELTAEKLIKNGGTSSQFLMADGSTTTGGGGVTSVTATSPITSSGGTTPVISTSMATNKLIGRSTTGTGVMEEITVGSGLTLYAGTLTNTATPTPLGYYGAFQDMLTQTLTTANVGQPFLIRTVDESNQVSITTNGSGEYTRITPANTGTYNIQWSGQFQNPTNAIHDVNIWFRKGLTSSSGPGTDIVGSNGLVALPARKSASVGEEGHIVAGWNFLLTISAGEYVEFYWMSPSTQVTLQAYSAGSPPPSTASLIVTVTQQSGIMAGTGITALGTSGNSQTGATQALATNASGTDFNIVSSGNTHTFNLPDASATARGAVTTIAQTFLGYKTFTTGLKVGVNSTFTESSGTPYLFHPTAGTTFYIGGTPGAYQNNLSVPIGTLNIGLQTASTIASFDASKNVVSLATATYPNLTELSYLKGVTSSIQTQFTGKVSTNTAITGATNTKITYDSKGLVTAGTTLIASDIPNIAQSQVTSLTTDLGLKQDKSLSAYSMVANNTASTANATEFTFRRWNQATYGGTLAWVGTQAPTTITAQSYSGQQVGNMVSINLSVVYTNAGVANTQVTLPLPSDFPTPVSPTGFTGALDVIAYGTGQIMANTAQTVATGARGCFLRRNAANNGYEFFINVSVATAARVAMLNLTYQTS